MVIKKIVILVFLLLIQSSCSATSNEKKLDYTKINESIIEKEINMYDDIIENSNFKNISFEDLKNSSTNSLVYFGRSTCVYCRKLMIKNGIYIKKYSSEISYIDTDKLDSNEKKELRKFYKVKEVPTFMEVDSSFKFTQITLEDFERRIKHEQ